MSATGGSLPMDLNIGIQPLLDDDASVGMGNNTGIEAVLDDDSSSTMFINTGALLVPAKDGSEAMGLNVDATAKPIPHIWAIYKTAGLVGDTVTIYGHGFYSGMIYDPPFEPIPDGPYNAYYEIGNTRGNTLPAPGTRYVIGSGGELISASELPTYGDPPAIIVDRTGVAAPQIVDLEHEKLVVTIPVDVAVAPGSGPGPFLDWIDMVDSLGNHSNKASFGLYPLVPQALRNSPGGNRGATLVRVLSEPVDTTAIIQTSDRILLSPRMVVRGYPERMPMFAAFSASDISMGTTETQSYVDIARDNTLDFGANGGIWYPVTSTFVDHPEIGTGVSLWEPWLGNSTQRWRLQLPASPYVDPAYEVLPGDSWIGLDPLLRPALVFAPGQSIHLQTDIPSSGTDPQAFSLLTVFRVQEAGETIMHSESVPDDSANINLEVLIQYGAAQAQLGGPNVSVNTTEGVYDTVVLGITVSGNRMEVCWGAGSLDQRVIFNPEQAISTDPLQVYIGSAHARFVLLEVQLREAAYSPNQLRDATVGMAARYQRN